MRVLGLSAFYHDASAALVEGGRVTAAAAEERFTLQKHDPNFPAFAAAWCLERAGVRAADLDAVVFYEEPHVKFSRVFASAFAGWPGTRAGFVRSMRAWMGSKLWIRDEISRRLDVDPDRVHFAPHHASHAAQAFAASPFDDAAVLVADAVGEWDSTSLWRARHDGGLRLERLDTVAYPHSLGLVYAAFTGWLGFRVNDAECSTMALAAFGRPVHADKVRRVLRPQADGTYAVDPGYFAFDEFRDSALGRRFLELFGPPRDFRAPLTFDSLAESAGAVPADAQRWADAAASVQLVLEEALLGLCRRLRERTGASRLCLAGGVALNAAANRRLIEASGFDDIFIPPDPGDGGAAAGAALHGYFALGGRRAAGWSMDPFLGRDYDAGPALETLARLEAGPEARVSRPPGFDALAAEVVDDLRAGKVVAWFQGRFENGPRALGNRSLLADPSHRGAAARLSQVKRRAAFRPYALSVAAEQAARVLGTAEAPRAARWMQATLPVADAARPAVRTAMHADGTTRPQVCSASDNPRLHRLLSLFGEAGGTAALLNTSMNAKGLPIASSPEEALLLFAKPGVDTLVLGDALVRKEGP